MMKIGIPGPRILVLTFVLAAARVVAGDLTPEDIAKLKADVTLITEATMAGDPGPIVRLTHHSLVNLVGGPEKFEEVTRAALAQLREIDMKMLSSETGEPDRTWKAGDEEVCFVPRRTVSVIDGKKIRSTTFMVAFRRPGSSTWTYIDGAGLREHPGMLRQLVPALDPDVRFPENYLEML